MTRRKKLSDLEAAAAPPVQARAFDGSPPGKARSTCSRCGKPSAVATSLCGVCEGELAMAGAEFAGKEARRRAVARERKKTMGW